MGPRTGMHIQINIQVDVRLISANPFRLPLLLLVHNHTRLGVAQCGTHFVLQVGTATKVFHPPYIIWHACLPSPFYPKTLPPPASLLWQLLSQ